MEINNEQNPLKKKSHGQLTAEIGNSLLEAYNRSIVSDLYS